MKGGITMNEMIKDVNVIKTHYDFEGNQGYNYSVILKLKNVPIPVSCKVKAEENTRNLLDLVATEKK